MLYAFPGFMSSDSVDQLYEARTREFNNAHPPLMAALWGVLDMLVTGPLLMLLAQAALFLGGSYGVIRQVLAPRPAAVAAVGLLLVPPVLSTMAVIWKDSQMAAYLLAGTAAMLSPRRGVRIGGLALISAACAFRYNGFAAAVPLVGFGFEWRPGLRWWKRYLISGAAAIAVVVLAFGVNRALTVEEAHMTPAYGDIVGVLAFTGDRTDADLRQVLRDTPLVVTRDIQATARRLYDPRNSYHLTTGPQRMFDGAATPLHQQALARAWKELIRGDLEAYLSHRRAMFAELLGLSDRGLWGPVYLGFTEFPDHPDYIEHDTNPSTFQVDVHDVLVRLAEDTPLFAPYLYAVLALIFLVAFSRDRISFTLLVSGLLYELSFLPTAGTPDCRYSHWMITCTCLAAVVIFVRRLDRGRARRAAT